jgi:hypothetical protein
MISVNEFYAGKGVRRIHVYWIVQWYYSRNSNGWVYAAINLDTGMPNRTWHSEQHYVIDHVAAVNGWLSIKTNMAELTVTDNNVTMQRSFLIHDKKDKRILLAVSDSSFISLVDTKTGIPTKKHRTRRGEPWHSIIDHGHRPSREDVQLALGHQNFNYLKYGTMKIEETCNTTTTSETTHPLA